MVPWYYFETQIASGIKFHTNKPASRPYSEAVWLQELNFSLAAFRDKKKASFPNFHSAVTELRAAPGPSHGAWTKSKSVCKILVKYAFPIPSAFGKSSYIVVLQNIIRPLFHIIRDDTLHSSQSSPLRVFFCFHSFLHYLSHWFFFFFLAFLHDTIDH